MIERFSRKNLDVKKYDTCIENSLQSNPFAFSWYLDIVCDNWDVFVLNDYEAVMPVPWRNRLGLKYVYTPEMVRQLGIFSKNIEDENEFLIELFDDFKFVELGFNSKNHFSMFHQHKQEKIKQVLNLDKPYKILLKKYSRIRKRELQKAKKEDLVERWNVSPEEIIEIFKKPSAKNLLKKDSKKHAVLLLLIQESKRRRVGELLCIYNKEDELLSAAFYVKYKNEVTKLVCSSDFSKKTNKVSTFMNDCAIFKYQPHYDILDFGFTSKKKIKKYYLSLGASNVKSLLIKQNRLPKLVRLFKR